jgi:cytidine deaminase
MDSHDMTGDETRLIEAATDVRQHAHAPYSGYRVGAAVLDETGRIHTGCNVENAAYPEGTCAEENAIGSMVAAGGKRIVAIAAVGGATDIEACTPCGGCRQRILEFADENTRIILIGEDGRTDSYTIDALLPASFRLN